MSMTELKVLFPDEKLDALRFFMSKKDQAVEQELKDFLDKTYEKLVPAQVKEYLESRMGQVPEQQTAEAQGTQEPESSPAARERPARQARRQREQATSEQTMAPGAPSEAEGPDEQESQGMTMSM